MTGEYEDYDLPGLIKLIKDEDPDELDSYSQGWSNAASVFSTELETLKDNLEAIQQIWTSKSAAPYLVEMKKAVLAIDEVQTLSEGRSGSLVRVASSVREAHAGVDEQWDEWVRVSDAAVKEQKAAQHRMKTLKGQSFTDLLADNKKASEDLDATEAERRKPFEKAARKHLNSAVEVTKDGMGPMVVTPRIYRPVPAPPGDPGDWDRSDLNNIDVSGKGSQSYSSDGSAASAVSHASSSPILQSGGPSSAPAPMPGAAGGTAAPPANPGMGAMPTGMPVGGVPAVGRAAVPPATTPNPNGGSRISPSRGAQRTPSLPNSRGGSSARSGMGRGGPNNARSNTSGRGNTARGNTANRSTAKGANNRGNTARNASRRGLQKSQMAPKDRTGRVRGAKEVMGQRPGKDKTNETSTRRAQRSIVGRGARGKLGGNTSRRGPLDRTKQGFTRQVLGQRGNGKANFSRTPIVANKVHDAGRVFGKRHTATPEEQRQQRMQERRSHRDTMQSSDGLSRPIIGNGITTPTQLPNTAPQSRDAVTTNDKYWQSTSIITPSIIGARRPQSSPHHDPGPHITANNSDGDSEETTASHDPGPTAFTTPRTPPTLQ